MEEKKGRKAAKKVAMNEAEQPKKLTYEQLEEAARQIAAQADMAIKENQSLRQQLQQLNMSNLYTEMNFLFKAVEQAHAFDEGFVDKCVARIQAIMSESENEDGIEDGAGESQ